MKFRVSSAATNETLGHYSSRKAAETALSQFRGYNPVDCASFRVERNAARGSWEPDFWEAV